MTTVRDLIYDAALNIGAVASGDALDPAIAEDLLRYLNRMLSSWANEDLMCYTVDRQTFNLVGGVQSYTIGVGGTFNTAYPVRPGQINLASVMWGTVEIPIDILNDEQWRDITVKPVNSTIPLQMWANGNYPLNTLYFWPIPTMANQLILSTWGQITAFSSINTTVNLPQGYEEAIVSNLSPRIAPMFGKQADPLLLQLAASSKAKIKAMNWEPTYRTVDSALSGSRSSIGQKSRGYVVDG